MTISQMAMNVGHQVFLNNCWGLKYTAGRTNVSSLNTPPQQLHSEVKVIQRSRCKQRNRIKKLLWSLPLRKRLRCCPNHPSLFVRLNYWVHILCDLFLAGQSRNPSTEFWAFMLLENWSQTTPCVKLEVFPDNCHKLPVNMWIHDVTTFLLAVPQGTISHHGLSPSSSKSLWKVFFTLWLGVVENCKGLRQIS